MSGHIMNRGAINGAIDNPISLKGGRKSKSKPSWLESREAALNTNFTTHEQASEKNCPLSGLMALILTSAGKKMEDEIYNYRCKGPGCMFWRWSDSLTTGFCGMAGVPVISHK